jgi:uncharacterized membrane protein
MVLVASFLAALGLAIIAVTVLFTAANYESLPDRVPTHFGFSPVPNAYGPKPMVWLVPVITIVVFGIQTLAYAQTRVPLPKLCGILVISDAVALALLATQRLTIETAKNGPSVSCYRTFLFSLLLTIPVVLVSAFLLK